MSDQKENQGFKDDKERQEAHKLMDRAADCQAASLRVAMWDMQRGPGKGAK